MGIKQEIIRDLSYMRLMRDNYYLAKLQDAYEQDKRMATNELMYSKGYNNISSTKGK